MGLEDSPGLGADLHPGPVMPDAGLLHEALHQARNVLSTLTEWRHADVQHVQAKVEVPAEVAHLHQAPEVLVGGGDDPNVHPDGFLPPHPVELPFLQDPEELGLGGEGHLSDLVQEDGAVLGQLEESPPGIDGPGEGTLLVAEELALQERVGEGGHVHGDERLVPPGREGVDPPGDEFLAGAGLSRQEDSGVHRSELDHPFQGLLDGVRLSHDSGNPFEPVPLDVALPHQEHFPGVRRKGERHRDVQDPGSLQEPLLPFPPHGKDRVLNGLAGQGHGRFALQATCENEEHRLRDFRKIFPRGHELHPVARLPEGVPEGTGRLQVVGGDQN